MDSVEIARIPVGIRFFHTLGSRRDSKSSARHYSTVAYRLLGGCLLRGRRGLHGHFGTGSASLRPGTIRPATFGPGGRISGTDFAASVPAGFGNAARAFTGNPDVEAALKKIPITSPGPGIIVIVSQAPTGLSLAPYGDIMYSKQQQDSTSKVVHVNSALHSASIAGQATEEYTTTDAGGVENWTAIVLYKDLSYEIELVAPASQFASARARYFTAFLAAWHWR